MDLHHLQEPHYYLNVNPDPGGGGGGGGERDRFPQWSQMETKEFLAVRAELDRSFMETKRNKHLWAAVSAKMADKGFHRTPEQCKCKWKNLVTRYKGSEAIEGETSRQFPFHDDMRKIFSQRMEGIMSFDEVKQAVQTWSEGDDTNVDPACGEEQENRKKRKATGASSSSIADVKDVESALREFMRCQAHLYEQWLQAAEAREAERREKEMEWRRAMEALAAERAALQSRWWAAEEERRVRQEARAERRDALISALLNKLAQKGL